MSIPRYSRLSMTVLHKNTYVKNVDMKWQHVNLTAVPWAPSVRHAWPSSFEYSRLFFGTVAIFKTLKLFKWISLSNCSCVYVETCCRHESLSRISKSRVRCVSPILTLDRSFPIFSLCQTMQQNILTKESAIRMQNLLVWNSLVWSLQQVLVDYEISQMLSNIWLRSQNVWIGSWNLLESTRSHF